MDEVETPQELRVRMEAIRERLGELDSEFADKPMTKDARREWNELNEELEAKREMISERETRLARLAELARNPANREHGSNVPPATRDAGLRVIDRHTDTLSAEAADSLEDVVRRDRSGVDSRYLDAVANPDYVTAWGKRLVRGQYADQEMTERERTAVARVAEATSERAMAEGVGSTGGFGIPFTLDPSIQLTSDGAVNPLRQLARVVPVTTSEWKGVSSAGVVASWDPEATEVSDDSPTLAQPVAKAEKLAIFVPYSIEIGEDYTTLTQELGELIRDAKDVLEATAFISGAGTASNQPQGLLVGGTIVVTTAGTALTSGIYSLSAALGPRYTPRASWISSRPVVNTVYREVAEGDTVEPKFMPETRDQILGQPWTEVSTMTTNGTATGGTVVTYGDYNSAYTIAERVGMTTELIPHLFGTVANRPTGQRGLYAYARVGAVVTNINAVKSLKIS